MEEDIERNKSISPSERKKSLEDLKKEFSDGIPKCGTDALRFGLCTYDVKGNWLFKEIIFVCYAVCF